MQVAALNALNGKGTWLRRQCPGLPLAAGYISALSLPGAIATFYCPCSDAAGFDLWASDTIRRAHDHLAAAGDAATIARECSITKLARP